MCLYYQQVWYGNVDWIFVAQEREDWQAYVSVAIQFWVQYIKFFDSGAVYLNAYVEWFLQILMSNSLSFVPLLDYQHQT